MLGFPAGCLLTGTQNRPERPGARQTCVWVHCSLLGAQPSSGPGTPCHGIAGAQPELRPRGKGSLRAATTGTYTEVTVAIPNIYAEAKQPPAPPSPQRGLQNGALVCPSFFPWTSISSPWALALSKGVPAWRMPSK